jgi:hypothetical protein
MPRIGGYVKNLFDPIHNSILPLLFGFFNFNEQRLNFKTPIADRQSEYNSDFLVNRVVTLSSVRSSIQERMRFSVF